MLERFLTFFMLKPYKETRKCRQNKVLKNFLINLTLTIVYPKFAESENLNKSPIFFRRDSHYHSI
jgi:hypothetical protein